MTKTLKEILSEASKKKTEAAVKPAEPKMAENVDIYKLPWIVIYGTPFKDYLLVKRIPDELKQNLTVKSMHDFAIKQDEMLDEDGKLVVKDMEELIADIYEQQKTIQHPQQVRYAINGFAVKCLVKNCAFDLSEEDVRKFGKIAEYAGKKYYKLEVSITSICS